MEYTKPEFIAQNSAEGSFAAGCPTYDAFGKWTSGNKERNFCEKCERTE